MIVQTKLYIKRTVNHMKMSAHAKSNRTLITILILLIIVFASISVFEFVQISSLNAELDKLKQPSQVCINDDTVSIKDVGVFA